MTLATHLAKVGYKPETSLAGVTVGQTDVNRWPGEILRGFQNGEKPEFKDIQAKWGDRELYQRVLVRRVVEDSLERPFTDAIFLAFLLGRETVVGTTFAGFSTTLSSGSSVGATTVSVGSTVGIDPNEYMRVQGNSGTAYNQDEFRKVTSVGVGTVSFAEPMLFAHAAARTVIQFTTPFTHTIVQEPADPHPSLAFEAQWEDGSGDSNNYVAQLFRGCVIDSWAVQINEGEVGTETVNFKGVRAPRKGTHASDPLGSDQRSTITAPTTRVEPLKFGGGAHTYFGTSVAEIRSAGLSFSNSGQMNWFHFQDDGNVGGLFPHSYQKKIPVYTIDSVVVAKNRDYLRYLLQEGTLTSAQTFGTMTMTVRYRRGTDNNDYIECQLTRGMLDEAPYVMNEEGQLDVRMKATFLANTIVAVSDRAHHYRA